MVERFEHLTIERCACAHRSVEFREIKGVQRLSSFKHHVIGDVDGQGN